MSKWMKVDPATLKVGDEVRWVVEITGGRVIRGSRRERSLPEIHSVWPRLHCTWQRNLVRRKTLKKAKPPVRPDMNRQLDRSSGWTGRVSCIYGCMSNGDYGYVSLLGDREGDLCTWTDITDHGDTITRFYRPYRNRPDEPPVGSFFRVDGTGELYLRMHEGNGDYGYVSLRETVRVISVPGLTSLTMATPSRDCC